MKCISEGIGGQQEIMQITNFNDFMKFTKMQQQWY